jgi:hypothetical protein
MVSALDKYSFNIDNYFLTLVFIDRALQVKEWTDEWPDESEAIIYCTPQDVVKNMNLGDGLDATSVSIKITKNRG